MEILLLDSFFSNFGPGNYIMMGVLLVGIVALYIWGNHYKVRDSRAEMLQRKYAVLDREKLAAIPDEELIEAVVANIMAKTDKKRPDPYRTVTQQSHGRNAVYCVWLISKELDAGSFEELREGPSAAFLELAGDGFEAVGSPGCAAAVRGALTAETEEARAELHADFLEQAEVEQPLQKCVEYIRDNPTEFVDEDTPEQTDAESEEEEHA